MSLEQILLIIIVIESIALLIAIAYIILQKKALKKANKQLFWSNRHP